MSSVIRILLVDDDRDDYVLTRDLLTEGLTFPFKLDWAAGYDEGIRALEECEHDVYLFDYRMGARTGLELLIHPAAKKCDAPFILLTGQGERRVDLEAMEAGAADYVPKENLSSGVLERTIRHSLERHRDRKALRQLNEALETRVEQRTRELERLNAVLQLADKRKDEFLAILSHELRNPLAPIVNAVQLMKRETNLELWQDARTTMERQLNQLVRLVDDLLEISRISRGKIELRRTPVNLKDIIDSAVEASKPMYELKRHSLTVQIPNDKIILNADPARMTQTIGNLLNNACKFTPPQGAISVAVEEHPDSIVIGIRDNGVGIPKEQLPQIFEMFTQVNSTLERSEGGLGIGLTLVKTLVELHGGSIQVTSPGPNQGSEFIIRLPIDRSADRTEPIQPSDAAATATVRRRILIVDDNRDSALSLSMLLKLDDHEVFTAFDGPEGIEAAEKVQPDLILLDIGLPKLNGYEVAKKIRSEPWGQKLVLVAMTGWGQQEDRDLSKAAGFDRHMIKPVEHDKLLKLIAECGSMRSVKE